MEIRAPLPRGGRPLIYSIKPCSNAEKFFGSKPFSQSANKPFLIKERFSGILARRQIVKINCRKQYKQGFVSR
jgi:hypothetical protein